jgi:uncharacterized protein DUF4062
MNPRRVVYVSSTFSDLRDYRAAVNEALRQMQYDVRCMEDYLATDKRTVDRCLQDVANCHIYVGMFAHRYGWVPDGEQMSITELEYRKARELGKTCLLFLVDPAAPWPPPLVERPASKHGQSVRRLRQELEPCSPSFFTDQNDLVRKVMAAVHLAEATMDVSRIELPNQLKDADPLYMRSSTKGEIEAKVRILKDARPVALVHIDLQQEWWSSRLHLLAALAMDYTEIRRFVFVGTGGSFCGLASPESLRRALTKKFRKVETTYLDSLPDQTNDDQQVPSIVRNFRAGMAAMPGGERANIQIASCSLLTQWLEGSLQTGTVEQTSDALTPPLLYLILNQASDYVVLTREGELKRIVDRLDLAARIAKTVVEGQLKA